MDSIIIIIIIYLSVQHGSGPPTGPCLAGTVYNFPACKMALGVKLSPGFPVSAEDKNEWSHASASSCHHGIRKTREVPGRSCVSGNH